MNEEIAYLKQLVNHSITLRNGQVVVLSPDRLRETISHLVHAAAVESAARRTAAQFLVRGAAEALGIYPASLHDLYQARGAEDIAEGWTIPAFNLRVAAFASARSLFRVARKLNVSTFICELARVEIGWTGQSLAEYATNVLGAAIAEGYQGPVFLQGDHFQISPARYATDPQSEIAAVRDLIATAIKVGFYNIDIDASTLVNLDAPSPAAQQAENGRVTAILSATIRDLEPAGITVAIGGEIGEVGSHLSTPVELEAFMTCFHKEMAQLAPEKPSLCKISVHTGTKHGGEMRPDGSFAPIELDFAALQTMSALARTKYGMGGCVQHGASTLSMAYFPKLAAHGAVEVHLATGLMRTFYTHIPESLRREMRDWMEMEYAAKREPEMSDVQFYHSVEMLALRPFKSKILALSSDELFPLMAAWETQFEEFINHLGVADSASWISPYAGAVSATFSMTDYQNIIPSEILLNDLAG